MASVRPLTRESGKVVWNVQIRRTGWPPTSGTFDTEAEAREFEADIEAQITKMRERASDALPRSGTLLDEKLVKTLGLYLNSPKCTDQHKRILPSVLRNVDEDVTLGEISEAWIEDYIDRLRASKTKRGDQYAYSTINKHLVITKVAIKWRAKRTRQPVPPFDFTLKMFPKNWENKRDRRLDLWEERLIHKNFRAMPQPSRHHWKLLLRFAVETGARLQELVLAEWREISACGTFWTIPAEHCKTGETRVMPLTRAAKRIVRILRHLAFSDSTRIFHMLGTPGTVSVLWGRWMRAWGIHDLHFHDIRHEGISRLVLKQRNYSVFEIMIMVGHSDPDMLRRYTNLRGDELAAKMI